MEVGHDEKTKSNEDDAENFYAIVVHDAASNILGDWAIIKNTSASGGEN